MDGPRGITRRAVLRAGGAATAAAALGSLAAKLASDRSDRSDGSSKPNVLIVMADDMRADFLPFAENVQNSLGSAGREFTAARANVSLCQPFRVGLLTGQWSKRHKMLGNGDTRIVPHDNTLGRWVQDAGYRTALIGKYLNGAPAMTPKPQGWTTWRQLIGDSDPNSYRRLGFSVHDGSRTTQPAMPEIDYLRDEVISFVAGSEPWFCMMTPTNPHFPFEPAPEDESAWSDLEWETPEEDDVSDKPSWYASLPPLSDEAKAGFRDIARGQAREIRAVDRAVAAVLESLSVSTLENTLVIFTSDGGINYGEHRSPYAGASKNDFYEHTLRVPLLCRGPGFTVGTSDAPVSAEVDISRTVVAVTGAVAGLEGDGEDLRAIQDKPFDFADRHLLHERGGGGSNNPNPASGLCVTTASRKLMRWTGRTGRDRYEAYDIDTDPWELRSWAFDPKRLTERDALEAQLDRLCPPPSLVPTLLYGVIVGEDLPLVTTALVARYHSVVMIDVFTSSSVSDPADLEITGDCLEHVALVASDERTDVLGVVRRLESFSARGTGREGAVTVSGGTRSISSVGLSIAEYGYGASVVQSLAHGSTSSSESFGLEIDHLQSDQNTSHLAVLASAAGALAPAHGETILYAGSHADPAARFSVLWAGGGGQIGTRGSPAPTWSAVASEIGT